MNQHNIEPVRLIVDNTQPEYPQYVIKVVAMVGASDETNTRHASLQYIFDVSGQPPADTFTAYEQLTKEQVLGWIMAEGMAEQVTAAYAAADQQLDPTPTPIAAMSLPWAPPPPTFSEGIQASTNANINANTSSTSTATVVSMPGVISEEKITALIYRVLDEIEASKV